jgi:nucleotide-binding universal stress UspA family protein
MAEPGSEPDVYLVVMDGTPECRRALRYAALRASRTGGRLRLIHVIQPAQFVQWGAIQADMEAEAQQTAEQLLAEAAQEAAALTGIAAETLIRRGRPSEEVLASIQADRSVRALVLAAAARGRPGPLIEYFAGEKAAHLPCLITIIPGAIADADLERLA